MTNWSKKNLLLGAIIGLSLIFRLYGLGKVPGSLEWDEVAIGYDSYSLLKTGRDQFHVFLPLTFRSLDDWKPPVYEYLTVVPIMVFDLNEFSVRLPSALNGFFAVILTYYLVQILFAKTQFLSGQQTKIALYSSLFLAVSPWHLQFSRAAFEVNIAVAFLIAGVLCFFLALRRRQGWLLPASIFFGLILFSYHSARVVGPILLVALIFLFRNQLRLLDKKALVAAGFILGLFCLVFLPLIFSREAQIRFAATNILDYRREGDLFVPGLPERRSAEKRLLDQRIGFAPSGKVVHNQRIAFFDYDFLAIFLRNYLAHFQPDFLFVSGDAPLHHAPDYGMLHPWDSPFLIVGLYVFFKKMLTKTTIILFLWFLIAPIPAAVTWQVPHSVRTEIIMPTFPIFISIGIVFILFFLRKESKTLSYFCGFILFGVLLFNVLTYFHQYYAYTNFKVAREWLFGRKEAALFAEKNKDKYQKIIVSTKLEQPHVFFLFYLRYNPQQYLKEGGTVSGGFLENRNHFDKYEFMPINYGEMQNQRGLLLIGLPKEFPPNARPIKIINLPNGEDAISLVAT